MDRIKVEADEQPSTVVVTVSQGDKHRTVELSYDQWGELRPGAIILMIDRLLYSFRPDAEVQGVQA